MTTGSENIEWCVQQQQQQLHDGGRTVPLLYRLETLPSGNRRAIANQTIAAGQVIFKNAPLTMVPHDLSNHCSHCFQPPSKRCSACQEIWYCSRNCQVHDFPFHRIECQKVTTQIPSTFAGTSDAMHNDTRLLIRTLVKLQQQQQQQQQDHPKCRFSHGIHVCSANHFYQLQPTTTPLDVYDQQILQQAMQCFQGISHNKSQVLTKLGLSMKDIPHQLETILRRFRCNNFGVVNSLSRVVASGIYPLAALLNHSCAPNCLLRYTNISQLQEPGGAIGGTMVVEIVAAKDIACHEELSHSYVELVAPTIHRQEQLQQIYGFRCHCNHCQSPSTVSMPLHYNTDWKCRDLVQWILDYYNPTTDRSSRSSRSSTGSTTSAALPTATPIIQVSLDDLLQPPIKSTLSSTSLLQQIQSLQEQANLAISNDNVLQEQESLSQAIALFLHHHHPHAAWWFSMELYQLLCQRLSTWIVLQQPHSAIEDCEHVVAVLCLALHQIPSHPLLGLQLFTLGDLYAASGCDHGQERATKTYQWALSTLSISHGSQSEMVQLLHEKVASLA